MVIDYINNKKYHPNSQIKFKTTMLKSSLRDNSDVYILMRGTITTTGAEADAAARAEDERNEQVTLHSRIACNLLTA